MNDKSFDTSRTFLVKAGNRMVHNHNTMLQDCDLKKGYILEIIAKGVGGTS